jgi:DNA-binding transcriptional LysR family regulator
MSVRRLDNIDLRLLRVFVTLVDSGGFADTQITLNLSSSTLSTHLSTLEKKLGGPLCQRGRAGFRLTPFGEETYAAAKQLFADIDTFQARLGRNRGQLVGRLRIGIVDGVVTNPSLGLQAAIGRFMGYAEGVYVDLMLGTPNTLEQAITDGRRDLVVGPFSQKVPGIAYVPLHREPHALYCGKGHPLFAAEPAAITQAAIEAALFSVRGYRHLDDLYRVDHPRASASIIQMEAQVMLILSGRFIGFLPCHIGDDWARRGVMKRLKSEIFAFSSQHLAAIRRGDDQNPVVGRFLAELKRQAAEGEAAMRGEGGTPAMRAGRRRKLQTSPV